MIVTNIVRLLAVATIVIAATISSAEEILNEAPATVVTAEETARFEKQWEQLNSPESDGYSERASIKSDAIWKKKSGKIPVCWENPTNDNARFRSIVVRAVQESWGLHSKLEFTGWQKCVNGNRGIRIKIADEGAHTKGLGTQLDGKPNGMVLNDTYKTWNQGCRFTWRSCSYSIAVHEFGHALGFAHEHNRADTPGECAKEPQGTSGDADLTPWDKHSVMNYCNERYNNRGILSKWDVFALQKIYGRPS